MKDSSRDRCEANSKLSHDGHEKSEMHLAHRLRGRGAEDRQLGYCSRRERSGSSRMPLCNAPSQVTWRGLPSAVCSLHSAACTRRVNWTGNEGSNLDAELRRCMSPLQARGTVNNTAAGFNLDEWCKRGQKISDAGRQPAEPVDPRSPWLYVVSVRHSGRIFSLEKPVARA
jgi:hypothetical protein